MLATDKQGIPLTTLLSSARDSEYNLIFPTLDTLSIEKRPGHPIKKPKILVCDRGYDAKWVRDELRKRGITPKIPKRRKKGKTDEPKYNERIRPFYKTRWIVERTFAWMGNYRRVLTRWDRPVNLRRVYPPGLHCDLL